MFAGLMILCGGFQFLLRFPLQLGLGLSEAFQPALRLRQFSRERVGRLSLAPALILFLIGALRLGQQPLHGGLPVLFPFCHLLVRHRATGAGIRQDLSAVDGYVAQLHQSRFLAQPKGLYE